MSGPIYPSSRHDRPHARIYDHDLQHPAWKQLTPVAFKLAVALLTRYRPNNPNCFPVGARRISEMILVSPSCAKRAVDELINAGHLNVERKGRAQGRTGSRERMVSLTRYATETRAGDPELPVKVWEKRVRRARSET